MASRRVGCTNNVKKHYRAVIARPKGNLARLEVYSFKYSKDNTTTPTERLGILLKSHREEFPHFTCRSIYDVPDSGCRSPKGAP